MVTLAEIRLLALALPGVREERFHAQPVFCVGRYIFLRVTLEQQLCTLRLTPATQAALATRLPGRVRPAEGPWGARGWTHMRLDPDLALSALVEPLLEAWALAGRAPRRPAASEGAELAPRLGRVAALRKGACD